MMASTVTLETQVFWAPLATAHMEDAEQTKQQQPQPPAQQQRPSASTSSWESLSPGADENLNHLPAVSGRLLDEPIIIPSDSESEMDDTDAEGGEGGGHDGHDFDDSRSVDTLPSVNAIIASVAEARSDSTKSVESPSMVSGGVGQAENPCQPGSSTVNQATEEAMLGIEPSISVSGSPVGSPSVLPPTPPAPSLPQANEESQSPAESIGRWVDCLRKSRTPAQLDSILQTPEVRASRQQSLGISAGPDLEGNSYEDYYAAADPPQCPVESPVEAQGSFIKRRNRGVTSLAQHIRGISSKVQSGEEGDSDSDDDASGIHGDTEYCPSAADSGEKGWEEDGLGSNANGTEKPSRKRRNFGRSPATTKRLRCRSTTSRSLIATKSSMRTRKHTPAGSMLSPLTSHAASEEGDAEVAAAKFEEWPLQGAILKRVILDGVATFQLQFEWPPYTKHNQGSVVTYDTRRMITSRTSSGQARQTPGTRARFTPAEDDLLIKLKAGHGNLSWGKIHQRFSNTFPGRTVGSLQVHYSTKLKDRE